MEERKTLTETLTEMREQILAKAADSSEFRAQLLADPRATIEEETGMSIPDGFTGDDREAGTGGIQLELSSEAAPSLMSDAELAAIVGGSGNNDDPDWDEFTQELADALGGN